MPLCLIEADYRYCRATYPLLLSIGIVLKANVVVVCQEIRYFLYQEVLKYQDYSKVAIRGLIKFAKEKNLLFVLPCTMRKASYSFTLRDLM